MVDASAVTLQPIIGGHVANALDDALNIINPIPDLTAFLKLFMFLP